MNEPVDVLLINMPFASLYRPSIALSLFHAGLAQLGISSKVLYFTISFAERITSEFYVRLANQEPRPTDLVAEWIFAPALHGSFSRDDSFIREVLRERSAVYGDDPTELQPIKEEFITRVQEVQALADDFLQDCLQQVLSYSPRIVAFTSTFQQQIPSLALAKRIKAAAPHIYVVFGGHNCEGVMGAEMARQFSCIDAVVSGEGDIVFPQIVQSVLESKPLPDIPGLYTRSNAEAAFSRGEFPSAPSVRDMDTLPYPDYQDFFRTHDNSTLDPRYERQILFETSRGCWWGEVSHCTFCGLSSESMAYRSKSADRALAELETLTSRHPGCQVTVVDNIIDMKYFKDFVPKLAARKLNLHLFYETKSNLKKDQVRMMREAGFTMVQPGIESFSTKILELMGKGVKGLQNIQVLKWFKEYGIRPYWNILWGFPGEEPEEYARMAKLIPLLTHLPQPDSTGIIRLDRFSPNFKFAEKLGFGNVRPYPGYYHIYNQVSPENVANLAYYFRYDYIEPRTLEYTKPVWNEVLRWWQTGATSDLFSVKSNDALLIWDFRPIATESLTVLTEIEKILYEACDSIQTISQLKQLAEEYTNQSIAASEVEILLEPLLQRGLMLREGNSYLSLAIPLGVYQPKKAVVPRFLKLIQKHGRRTEHGIEIPLSARPFVQEFSFPR